MTKERLLELLQSAFNYIAEELNPFEHTIEQYFVDMFDITPEEYKEIFNKGE